MGLWKINRGDFSGCGGAALVVMCILASWILSIGEAQSIYRNGHLSIVNSIDSPTDITCYSYTQSRQLYTAMWKEVYSFWFHTADGYRFWDCQIFNRAWGLLGVFRFYGDDSHGGPELWDCQDCIWSVDRGSVSIFVKDMWQFKYRWPRRKGVQPQPSATPRPAT